MKRLRHAAAFLTSGLLLTSCGPDLGALHSYVVSSPRRTIAILPFTLADRQPDIRNFCESTLRDRLTELGFSVVENRAADSSQTVFGSVTPPRLDEVRAYGERCHAAVVLVGRLERAAEGKTFDHERRPANQPPKAAIPPVLDLRLKLFEVNSGRQLWTSQADHFPPEWTLHDAAQYEMERQSVDLAQTYAARRL